MTPAVRSAWDPFAERVAKGLPGALAERDVDVPEDTEWFAAATRYRELRTTYDELGTAVDEAKAKRVRLASHAKEQGGGVSLIRFWKRGIIDYKRVPVRPGVDVEQFRGPGREEVGIAFEQ